MSSGDIGRYSHVSQDQVRADLIQLDRAFLPKHFYEFACAAWHLIEPATPLVKGWYLEAICRHLQAVSEGKVKKLIINQPPRTAKSSIVSVLWPAWEWTRDPGLRWMFASYSQRLALRDSLRRREVICSSWYQARWGEKVQLSKDQREKSDFKNTAQGVMYCTSTGSTVTGRGGMRLILDDPQDPQGAESEIVREGTIDWLRMTWPSRKDSPEAAEVLVQQRLHENDATGLFLRQGGWTHLKIPMRYEGESNATELGYSDPRSKEGEILDDVRFPEPYLQDLETRLGPYGSAGQLQQRPAPLEGGIIKRSWLKQYDVASDGRISVMDSLYVYDAMSHFRFATVDLAAREVELGGTKKGQKTDPDYTVMAGWSIFMSPRGPILTLLDLIRDRLPGPEILPRLKAFHEQWRFALIGMETIAFQLALFQYAMREGLPVREISTRHSDDVIYRIDRDKTSRVIATTPLLAAGRFWIPQYKPWLQDYIKELVTFPNASHDDCVDVTAFAVAIAGKFRPGAFEIEKKPTMVTPDSGINPGEVDEYVSVDRRVWDVFSVPPPPGY